MPVSTPTVTQVDMIAVPTSRPVSYLSEAARLAERLGCVLLVLASGRCHARQVIDVYEGRLGGRLIAVDVPPGYTKSQEMFQFEADAIAAGVSPRVSDVSVKRNLALVIARATGVRRLFFLDDDLVVPDWVDVLRAASTVGKRHRAAGMRVVGFLDNSVVCHANRLTGGQQDTFVGAGALMVNPQHFTAFFPDVYNEDWFYLLDCAADRAIGMSGIAAQREFDPFRTPERARREEFGDVLAESLFSLLESGSPVSDADVAFWRTAIDRRRRFIDEVGIRVASVQVPPAGQRRIAAALEAAKKAQRDFTPADCAGYVRAWVRDRLRWADRINGLTCSRKLGSVLGMLELEPYGSMDLGEGLPTGRRVHERMLADPLADQHGRPLFGRNTPAMLGATVRREPPIVLPAAPSTDSSIGVSA
ncbi:hypothetical protein [Cryptosporangium aurantiacum]|nr:hypothetical protein [Cryptosporangium aurantiacum]